MNITFARVTETHDCLAFRVVPCARFLYHWLLRNAKAGTPQEIELEAFQQFTAIGRSRPYCLKQVRKAFSQLVKLGLVQIVKQYSGTIFKLVAFHPDQEQKFPNGNESSQDGTKSSQKQASNPDSVVPINREFREQTDINPPTLPVVVEESGQIGIDFDSIAIASEDQVLLPDSDEIPETLITPQSSKNIQLDQTSQNSLNEVKQLISPQRLHSQLQKLVLETDLVILNNAIAVVREAKSKGTVKNPSGLLVRAIKGEWVPASPSKPQEDGFKAWYENAYKSGVIQRFTSANSQLTGFDDGVMCVMRVGSDRWIPWQEI
jgi:hypothetical protein